MSNNQITQFNDSPDTATSRPATSANLASLPDKKTLRQIVRQRLSNADPQALQAASAQIMHALEELPEFQTAQCVLLYWSLPQEVATHDFVERWYRRKQILLPVMHGEGLLLRPFTGRNNLVQRRFGVWEPVDSTDSTTEIPSPDQSKSTVNTFPDSSLATPLDTEHARNCHRIAHQAEKSNFPLCGSISTNKAVATDIQSTSTTHISAKQTVSSDSHTDMFQPDLIIVPGVGFSPRGERLGHGKGFYDRLLVETSAIKVGICFELQLFDRLSTQPHDIPMDKLLVGSPQSCALYDCLQNRP